jgi:methylated-DNA-[protein]-cysteine S-methyltransferase
MTGRCFTVFDTAIGSGAIAWSEVGIVAVQLPEADAAMTRDSLKRRVPDAVEAAPPAEVAKTVAGIVALLSGERRDLRDAVIDDRAIPAFNRRVYAIVRQIPPGETKTYGEIAERLGDKSLARAVGQAMGENPTPIVMPCHRVLAAGGKNGGYKAGGFSAPGGAVTKLRLLTIEGAQPGEPTLFNDLPLLVAPDRRR